MSSKQGGALLNDSALLLRERSTESRSEAVPWPELVQRLSRFVYSAMDREFDSKRAVLEKISDAQHWIRTFCPEGGARGAVLEGMLWTFVTDRFERTLTENERIFVIESNIRAQHGLLELRTLTFTDRVEVVKALQEGEGGDRRTTYLAGALAVARVAIAIEGLGHTFRLASLAEDFEGGIDGWLDRKGRPSIPLDVKHGLRRGDGHLVRPHTLSIKVKGGIDYRQRNLLTRIDLEPRVLRFFVPGSEDGSMVIMHRRGPILEPLRRALEEWHRSPFLLRGNVRRPRLPRKRYH